MPDIAASHANRLGCSMLAQALGVTRNFGTRYDLWAEYSGRKTREDIGNELRVALGTPMEDVLKPFVEARLGRKLRRDRHEYVHPTLPLVANLDFRAEALKGEHHRPVVDTKTSLGWGARHRFGEDGTDQVDEGVLLQMQGYTLLTGTPVAYVAALVPGPELKLYTIEADHELHEMIEDGVADFWRLVETDTPPDPETEAEARQRWPRHSEGRILEADMETAALLCQLADCKRRGKEVAEEEQGIKDRLLPMLADADSVRRGEMSLATYRANKDSHVTNWKAMAQALSAFVTWEVFDPIRERYTTTQPGARVLRLAKDLERLS